MILINFFDAKTTITRMATARSLEKNLPMLMCRKEAKGYGTKKQIAYTR